MANEEKNNIGNREYKSDLFSLLMQEKAYALEVYNAVNDSAYDNPEEIEIITLEHGVSVSIRNDASFILDMNANYYEHQSTYNPNMPLRSLIYYVEDTKRKIESENKNLFGKKRISIPTPHFIVFYNGTEKRPEVEIQKLSASFCKETEEPELEVVCKVYNINPGNNEELMKKTSVLTSYTYLVEAVRKNNNKMLLKDAIHTAIDECIEKGILEDFLKRNRFQVEKVMNLDFTFERQLELTRNEEREEGFKEGREEGLKQAEEQRRRAEKAEAEVVRLKEELARLQKM